MLDFLRRWNDYAIYEAAQTWLRSGFVVKSSVHLPTSETCCLFRNEPVMLYVNNFENPVASTTRTFIAFQRLFPRLLCRTSIVRVSWACHNVNALKGTNATSAPELTACKVRHQRKFVKSTFQYFSIQYLRPHEYSC